MKILLFFTFIFVTISLKAKITRLHNAPRSGDQILKQRVSYKDPGRSGGNVIWDFGQLIPIDTEYELTYYEVPPLNDSTCVIGRDTIPATEVIAGVEHYTAYYYSFQNDTLFTLGHENPVVLMRHKPPLLSVPFPFGYGQETEKGYCSHGFYSSKESVVTEGYIKLKADAHGKMVLPSGDTLTHVLRIKSLQTIADVDTTHLEEERIRMETETFRWYVKGYRYPIFETIRTFDVSDTAVTEFFNTAFFYPPQEHLYLEEDSANLAVLDSLWNLSATTYPPPPNNGGNNNQPQPDLNLVYNYYPNPVRDILYVEYFFDVNATASITLFDMNGLPVRNIPERELRKGMYRDEINCSTLPVGNYVLQLKVGDEVVNGVVMKR